MILKSTPDFFLKKEIVSSLCGARWPEFSFSAREVVLGLKTKIKLIPHTCEYDLESLVSKYLLYEKDAFVYLDQSVISYDVIIDIGANVGIFSLFFSKKAALSHTGKPQIFAFEPSRKAYSRLIENVRVNNASNIHAFNCAVGQDGGFCDFFEPHGHLTNGSFSREFGQIFSPRIETNKVWVIPAQGLEQLVGTHGKIFIKIDTEGSEVSILRGLEQFIRKRKPTILLEVYSSEFNTLEYIFSCKYSLYNITDHGLVKYANFVVTDFRNYILI